MDEYLERKLKELIENWRDPFYLFSTAFEEEFLGMILILNNIEILKNVFKECKVEFFNKEAHQRIFLSILNLSKHSEIVDILTLVKELEKNGELEKVGGANYLISLTNKVNNSTNPHIFIPLLLIKYNQRNKILIQIKEINNLYNKNIDFKLNNIEYHSFKSSINYLIELNFKFIKKKINLNAEEINKLSKKDKNLYLKLEDIRGKKVDALKKLNYKKTAFYFDKERMLEKQFNYQYIYGTTKEFFKIAEEPLNEIIFYFADTDLDDLIL